MDKIVFLSESFAFPEMTFYKKMLRIPCEKVTPLIYSTVPGDHLPVMSKIKKKQ